MLVGLASSGIHTNGFSLVRKVLFEDNDYKVDQYVPELGGVLGEVLLAPHKSYLKSVNAVMSRYEIHAMAHLTGGGFYGNIPRVLPTDCQVTVERRYWGVPPIFQFIQEKGGIDPTEMHRTFNMGIGLVLIVAKERGDRGRRSPTAGGRGGVDHRRGPQRRPRGDHHMSRAPIRIAVLVSGQGRGSNMQAIIDACASGKINGEVALVIGSQGRCPRDGARPRGGRQDRRDLAKELRDRPGTTTTRSSKRSRRTRIDLICLAGYMRVLGQSVVDAYRGRIMNVHPALIPSFCGKGMYGHHVHEAVIERGVKYTGVTVHLVDEDYDTGPIVLQAVVPVEEDDTPDTLAARVLTQEHATYTDAIALFAAGRLKLTAAKCAYCRKEDS